jgi:hypothetical protein
VSFAAITFSVASERVFTVVVYFVINSLRKLLDTTSYFTLHQFSLYESHLFDNPFGSVLFMQCKYIRKITLA